MHKKFQFCGSENIFSDPTKSKIHILPVPYDGTSTWIKGADKGPLALLEASSYIELYDIETDSEVYKKGIYTHSPLEVKPLSAREVSDKVQEKVSSLLDSDKFVIPIGGEHSISIGAVKAYREKFDDLSVLQLDAHADLRDEYEGSKFNHACVMARVKDNCPIVQVGIRSVSASEKENIDPQRIFYAHDIHDNTKWIPGAINSTTDNVYVTIDLDVFDLSVISSTGTPEPGGLSWYSVLGFLSSLAEKRNIVGFDIVELCPRPETKTSDLAAAKLLYKLASYIFKGK